MHAATTITATLNNGSTMELSLLDDEHVSIIEILCDADLRARLVTSVTASQVLVGTKSE